MNLKGYRRCRSLTVLLVVAALVCGSGVANAQDVAKASAPVPTMKRVSFDLPPLALGSVAGHPDFVLKQAGTASAAQSSWLRRHPSKGGALIGLAAGAFTGLLASSSACFADSGSQCQAASVVIFGAAGAGAGALVGLFF